MTNCLIYDILGARRDNMKKVLAIYGSHRRHGNTDTALDALLEGMNGQEISIKKLFIPQLKISPCRACNLCFRDGKCVVKDDMQWVYEDLWEADMIIIATPIYFNNISSHLKIFIDRCQCLWAAKYLLKKGPAVKKPRLGHIICTSGSRMKPEEYDCAVKVIHSFYNCLYVDLKGKTLIADTDGVQVKDRSDTMEELRSLGKEYTGMLLNSI